MVTLIQLSDNKKASQYNWSVIYQIKTPELISAVVHEKNVTIANMKPELGWIPQTQVKVDCTCDDFKYRWAYVLWKQGALLYPEKYVLEPPKKRNPGMQIGACKHVSYVIYDLLEKKK